MADRNDVHISAVSAERSSKPGFAIAEPLPADLLYRRCDPAELPFALCSEPEEAPGPIGQERAADAIEFALQMRSRGYNVYALGAGGTGRHDMVENLLRARARGQPIPPRLVLRQ